MSGHVVVVVKSTNHPYSNTTSLKNKTKGAWKSISLKSDDVALHYRKKRTFQSELSMCLTLNMATSFKHGTIKKEPVTLESLHLNEDVPVLEVKIREFKCSASSVCATNRQPAFSYHSHQQRVSCWNTAQVRPLRHVST